VCLVKSQFRSEVSTGKLHLESLSPPKVLTECPDSVLYLYSNLAVNTALLTCSILVEVTGRTCLVVVVSDKLLCRQQLTKKSSRVL